MSTVRLCEKAGSTALQRAMALGGPLATVEGLELVDGEASSAHRRDPWACFKSGLAQ